MQKVVITASNLKSTCQTGCALHIYRVAYDAKPKRSEDHLVCTYDTHEDSVYAAEWSNVDPWVFASLSYDGRLVINHVPSAEKYEVLGV